MALGTVTINFGAASASGGVHATVDVTGQTGLSSTSYLEPFRMADATAHHTADEIMAESIAYTAEFLTTSSFRIHGRVPSGTSWGDHTVRWVTQP